MITWKLKKGGQFRKGHPWIFAKELDIEAGRMEPGTFVRIVNEKHEAIDFGYGNPNCALAFRSLGLLEHPKLAQMASVGPGGSTFQSWVAEQIVKSWKQRLAMGFEGSFRVVFSEVDQLPGLILDRYELTDVAGQPQGQVLAVQILTAGFDRIWGDGKTLMEKVVAAMGLQTWQQTLIVERKDTQIRKVEGLEVNEPRVIHWGSETCLKPQDEEALRHALVRVAYRGTLNETLNETLNGTLDGTINLTANELVSLEADLLKGQKTGFFLDQSLNMQLVLQALNSRTEFITERRQSRKPLRVLDLCSYVGHWSLQLGHFARTQGLEFEADLVDVSGEALGRAQKNLQRYDLKCQTFEIDVLKDTKEWPQGPYDIVIADPPAFVKAKKDLPQGLHAYLKINTEAIKVVAPQGLLVSCSCSGAVSEDDLLGAVTKAVFRTGRQGRILARGQQGWDHPWGTHFPEGRYLKMLLTQLN